MTNKKDLVTMTYVHKDTKTELLQQFLQNTK